MIKHISFAGIDCKTKIEDLQSIQKEFPLVEFGFISSKNWMDNGNRYPDPVLLKNFKSKGLNLCLHLCGEFARRPLKEGWNQIEEFYKDNLKLFNRVQLNVIGSKPKKDFKLTLLKNVQEVIIQQKSVFDMPIFEECLNSCGYEKLSRTSVLFDLSGGRGKYVKDFDVFEIEHQQPIKLGFAGGISPENCVDVVKRIEANLPKEIPYWIDMETGIRDERDWFSISKCRKVCEQVYNLLEIK